MPLGSRGAYRWAGAARVAAETFPSDGARAAGLSSPPLGHAPRLAAPRARRRGPTPASSHPRGSCAPASRHRADPSSRDRRLSSAPRWVRLPRTARRARSAANREHTPWGPPRNTRVIARVIPAASPACGWIPVDSESPPWIAPSRPAQPRRPRSCLHAHRDRRTVPSS